MLLPLPSFAKAEKDTPAYVISTSTSVTTSTATHVTQVAVTTLNKAPTTASTEPVYLPIKDKDETTTWSGESSEHCSLSRQSGDLLTSKPMVGRRGSTAMSDVHQASVVRAYQGGFIYCGEDATTLELSSSKWQYCFFPDSQHIVVYYGAFTSSVVNSASTTEQPITLTSEVQVTVSTRSIREKVPSTTTAELENSTAVDGAHKLEASRTSDDDEQGSSEDSLSSSTLSSMDVVSAESHPKVGGILTITRSTFAEGSEEDNEAGRAGRYRYSSILTFSIVCTHTMCSVFAELMGW